jgi:hypothetical protein
MQALFRRDAVKGRKYQRNFRRITETEFFFFKVSALGARKTNRYDLTLSLPDFHLLLLTAFKR